jgi:hypothetical protein
MCVYIHLEQVRNAGRALGSVMAPLLEEVQEGYRQHHHSCLLYLASEVIKVIYILLVWIVMFPQMNFK